MKLLILTQYFPPETGAPQNRLYELARRLKENGVEVEILTALPSYPKNEIYEGYRNCTEMTEILDGILVHRTSIYVTTSKGIVERLKNYFSFVRSSRKYGKNLHPFDFLLCESPPLFLGYSAIYLSKKLKAKLIFNVSDLWPESAEKMGVVNNKFLLKLAYGLEAKCYKKSFLVTGQTQGIVANIKKRFPAVKVHWLPNGAKMENFDEANISTIDFRSKNGIERSDLVFFYGGIIGHAQGLKIILDAAAQFLDKKIKFVIMGSGPEKEALMQYKNDHGLHNVIFPEPVGRTQMQAVLSEIDIALIPLRKLDIFTGAIPSKIFEALAMKKPLLLGVNGEACELFINQANAGWHFEPENLNDLCEKIRQIGDDPSKIRDYGINGRNFVSQNFDRNRIADDFLKLLSAT
ncbi:MAG: glycosyltransferase family 4 protein [Crocinitomicaceae bacterium]|nr:glycosyltransferase family 4 protein [Crocinitomicaceae bacterium]